MTAIRKEHAASGETYGSPRVFKALKRKGWSVGRKRIERLMRQDKLRGVKRRKFRSTTDSQHGLRCFPNVLQRQFTTVCTDDVWASDITYLRTAGGWLYLCVVLDLYSRRVIGWAMEAHLGEELALKALKMAKERRGRAPRLFHSDRGVQYASHNFTRLMQKWGTAQSMSRTGNCWDNAVVESFFDSLKTELAHLRVWRNHWDARRDVFWYIEVFYNHQRLHSTLGYMPPSEYEELPAAA